MVTTFNGINRLIEDVNIDSDYTIGNLYAFVYADASSATVTVTLTPSPSRGNEYTIKKINTAGSNVVVDGNGKNIDGRSTVTLTGSFKPAVTVRYSREEW